MERQNSSPIGCGTFSALAVGAKASIGVTRAGSIGLMVNYSAAAGQKVKQAYGQSLQNAGLDLSRHCDSTPVQTMATT